jgi:hypothetical protein
MPRNIRTRGDRRRDWFDRKRRERELRRVWAELHPGRPRTSVTPVTPPDPSFVTPTPSFVTQTDPFFVTPTDPSFVTPTDLFFVTPTDPSEERE